MKKGSTHFLRAVIIIMALAVLAFCIFVVPSVSLGVTGYLGASIILRYVIMAGAYISSIAFFIGLYQALLLLRYIDTNTAFSDLSAKALRIIGYCAVTMSAIYIAGLPVIYRLAQGDDAPGLIPLGTAFACAPLVVAVFAAVLRKLVQSAIEIKSENDLVI